MFDRSAAEDDDVGGVIEQRKVNADLHRVQRALVLGVEKAGMDVGDDARPPAAPHRRAFEFDDAISLEPVQQFKGFRPRQQHGMAEVTAGGLVRQNRGNEQALINFHSAAIALEAPVFSGEIRCSGRQSRHGLCCSKDKLLDADAAGTCRGQ